MASSRRASKYSTRGTREAAGCSSALAVRKPRKSGRQLRRRERQQPPPTKKRRASCAGVAAARHGPKVRYCGPACGDDTTTLDAGKNIRPRKRLADAPAMAIAFPRQRLKVLACVRLSRTPRRGSRVPVLEHGLLEDELCPDEIEGWTRQDENIRRTPCQLSPARLTSSCWSTGFYCQVLYAKVEPIKRRFDATAANARGGSGGSDPRAMPGRSDRSQRSFGLVPGALAPAVPLFSAVRGRIPVLSFATRAHRGEDTGRKAVSRGLTRQPRPAPKGASSEASQAQFHAFTATWSWAAAAESVNQSASPMRRLRCREVERDGSGL